MKTMYYTRILLMLLLFNFSNSLFSVKAETILSPGIVRGYIYDSRSSEPMEFTTVALKQVSDSSIVTGIITDINGFFRLKDVPAGIYFLDVSFMGYERLLTDSIVLTPENPSLDIGRLLLLPSDETLREVVVVADRPTMSYRIDKKVINVSQLHTSASGSAVDVLENIPSVTVSIEGDVSLRGSSSFTVLIDGKPSILDANDILNQIPASQIENIEIITNPSARFDPDGVAGIINIVMKKNRQQGMNGVVNLSAGTPYRYGGDFLFNYRRQRLNFYLGADYNQRSFMGQSTRINETYDAFTSFLNSDGDFSNLRNSWGMRGGIDFNINPYSSLGIGYRMGDRDRSSESERNYEEWTSLQPEKLIYSSFEESMRGGLSHSLTLDYKYDFDQEGHELLAHVVVSSRTSEENSLNLLLNNQLDTISGQRFAETGPSSRYTFRLDYTLPINDMQKLGAGYQTNIRNSDDSNVLYQFQPESSLFIANDLFSNHVGYNMMVHSAYATFSGMYRNLGYQAGTRAEYTDRLIELVGTPDDYTLQRWDFYPTLHFSYELVPEEQQMMASYTRRLQRLRGWYLEPFYTWRDAYNVRIGNPALDPEYIDSYEVSYQYRFKNGNVISTDLYYRVTNNKIERIRSIYDDQPNILLSSFANVGKDYSLGTEIMTGFDPTSWWHVDVMANIYDYRQEGELNGREYSASSFNWNTRLNNDFKITPSTRLQLRGMYNSPTVTAQGERTGYFVTNIAMKQDFLDRDLSVTLQVRDIFSTTGRETIYRDLEFYNFSQWIPNTPYVSLTLSYRINNYRSERRGPEQGQDDGDRGDDF